MSHLTELTIQVTKTADGKMEYVQIASKATFPVNIVLIADKITVKDDRALKGAKKP